MQLAYFHPLPFLPDLPICTMKDASSATVLATTQNHGYSPQSFQTIPPAWFIPIGPPDCPPIFTVGLGLGIGREEIDMLIKFGQQADWLLAPTSVPSGIPVKLLHAIIYQTVLFSPKQTSLESEELDQLKVPLQHSWLEQCIHAIKVINIEEDNLARLSESPGVKTESIFELHSRMARYMSKYVTLDTVCDTRELNEIVLLCLQLLLQTAIRRLSDFRRTSLGGRRTTNRQNSSMSNLTTTMTSYNSLASTSTSASCETVASNFPLKSEMVRVLTDKLRNSAPIDEANSIQVISVHLPETPKKESDRSHAQCQYTAAVDQISPIVINTLLAPKFLDASRKPQEIRAGDEKSDFPSVWIKSVVDRREGVTRKTLGTSPYRWGSSGNLICGSHKLSAQNFQLEFQQTSRTFVRCLSQSSPDIRVQTPLLFAQSTDSVSPLKTTTDVSDATKHSVVIRPIQADLCNKYSYSADHTYTSLSYDFTLDPGVPAVRDYLRRKLLSRILVEITTRLGSTQAEVVQLLPVFHEPNLMKLVDDVIDQAVAVTLTYRMNQLTNNYPSVPLSNLVTSSPVSVGLVMDKLLLDNLADTETAELTIPTFPSYTHLHRHTTTLIDTLIQMNEPLRTNPRMNQIKPDIVQVVLVLLWHSSYPAACVAMNRLLSENTNLEVMHNKSDTINSAPIPASSSDPSLYNDMWTTKISNVPCNMPLVKTTSSFADSRLTRIRTDGFGEPIIVTPRAPEISQLARDHASHEEVSNSDLHSHSPGPVLDVSDVECVSPLPIVSETGRVECGVTHYLSVQSSRSDSMQSKSSLNVADLSVLNEQVKFNGDMVRWRPKCLKFRLHGTATEYKAAIITEQQTTPAEAKHRQTVQTATSLLPTMAFGSSNYSDKSVLFCPGCTKLIQTYWNTYGCLPENKGIVRNGKGKDASVQWSSADAVGRRQIITTIETDRCKSMAANDHHFSVGKRSLSQTPRVRDSEETRMVLECTITRGRSRSQGAAEESMSSQSVLYHSMSLSMHDHQPEHCTSPLAELLGPESLTEKVMSIKHSQRIATDGNKKRLNHWFDSNEMEKSLYGKSDPTKEWSQVDGTRKSPGIASGNAGSPDKAVKPWILKASKPLFSGCSIRPDFQNTGTRPTSTLNNMLSATPFYSCLRELRDCLSRAESRLSKFFFTDLMAYQL